MKNEEQMKEYAWNWHTSENNRGDTVLTVQWRNGNTPEGVARFVELYEEANDCELEFMDANGHGASDWLVRYNEED